MFTSISDWTSQGYLCPGLYFRCQEASAATLTDDAQGLTLAVTGALEFQQTHTGDSDYWVKTSAVASQGARAAVGALWNIYTQAVVITLDFVLVSNASTAYILSLSGGDAYVSANDSGRLRLHNSGLTAGTYNYYDDTRHTMVLESIPSSAVPGYTGSGTYRLSTEKEQITGTWERVADGAKGIGITSLAPPVMFLRELTCYIGTDAQAFSTAGVERYLERRGYTVLY